jgi:hypothetical protein
MEFTDFDAFADRMRKLGFDQVMKRLWDPRGGSAC